MTRISRYSATAIALLSLALLGLGAGAAGAADPLPSPSPGSSSTAGSAVIHYDGTGTVTNTSGGSANTYPVTWTVDCTSTPCTITGLLVDTGTGERFPLTGGILQPFVGGSGTYSYPQSGDRCAGNFLGAYTITIVAAGNRMTSSFDLPGGGADFSCPNGSTVQYDPAHVEIVTTVTSGDTCHIFGTCPTRTAVAVPVSAGRGGPVVGGSTTARVDITGTTFSSPSTLSTLPTVATALTLGNVVWAAALTMVLVILVALPAHLINVSIEQGSEKVLQWWRRRRPAKTVAAPAVTASKAGRFAGWPVAAAGLLAASVISSFVSPAIGFNASSLRVFLSILVSFLLDAAVGWFLIIWLIRRSAPTVTTAFRFIPATLVIVVLAVLFTRVTGFQPGIVFGLVAGLVFGAALATADRARVALVPLGYSFAVAILAWIGYSIIQASISIHPGALVLFAQETLSAIAIAGIAALPIALLPLRGLAGHAVFQWKRTVWGLAYAIGLFGFFFVLMPKPFSWQGISLSLWVWITLFAAYSLLGLGLWLAVSKPWKHETTPKSNDEIIENGITAGGATAGAATENATTTANEESPLDGVPTAAKPTPAKPKTPKTPKPKVDRPSNHPPTIDQPGVPELKAKPKAKPKIEPAG